MIEGLIIGAACFLFLLIGWWMGYCDGIERGESKQFWRERGES